MSDVRTTKDGRLEVKAGAESWRKVTSSTDPAELRSMASAFDAAYEGEQLPDGYRITPRGRFEKQVDEYSWRFLSYMSDRDRFPAFAAELRVRANG